MKEKVKALLNITDIEKDVLIDFFIEQFTSKIKSICRREDFPKNLEYMCIKYTLNNIKASENGYGEGKNNVESITDGDQNIRYKNDTVLKKEDIELESFISKNIKEISNYALMGW